MQKLGAFFGESLAEDDKIISLALALLKYHMNEEHNFWEELKEAVKTNNNEEIRKLVHDTVKKSTAMRRPMSHAKERNHKEL